MFDDEDPTCLTDLHEDIEKGETLLRVFLEDEPGRSSDPESLKRLIAAGKAKAIHEGKEPMERLLGDCFPREYTLTDACLTNSGFIWFHKHFYL